MRKDKILTVSINNWLTLAFGLPTLIYSLIGLSTSVLDGFWGFIGLFIIGAVYWAFVEQHTNLRFAWLRENSGDPIPPRLRFIHPMNIIFLSYNLIYWLPVILGFTKVVDYNTAFIWFFAILIIRGIANTVRNNMLMPEKGENFPLRSP